MYEAEFARLYDRFYQARSGKDYAAEAAELTGHIRARMPGAASLLDVACGSGPHLEHFAAEFDEVAGLELSEAMIALARARLDGVPLYRGDMRDFSLGRRFAAVTCMFSSIGYVSDRSQLASALACCARHLVPGGVLVIEPWWFPDTFVDGYVAGDVVTGDGEVISRVSHSARHGDRTRIDIHWVVADATSGLRHLTERHELTLFDRADYETMFTQAGCEVEYMERSAGPGLFVGVRR